MTAPRKPFAPAFDAQAVHDTIQRALASAGLDTASGTMRQVTETIRRAMASGGMPARPDSSDVIDVQARRVDDAPDLVPGVAPDVVPGASPVRLRGAPPRQPAAGPADQRHVFIGASGRRSYRLHVPQAAPSGPRPLLVMLHGCTQSADDFAAGTRMNQLADEHGVLVVYPEQAPQANASGCWNWFKPEDQARGAGEPALIAGIVREVAARQPVDPQRVFVAGLSAGAAMAVVLGQTYPELFAAVGVHSGLPYASAQDMPSALAKMKGGRSGLPGLRGRGLSAAAAAAHAVPTIVFHGDRDHLVQHSNGAEVLGQCLAAFQAQPSTRDLSPHVTRGVSAGGCTYTRTVHADAQGRVLVEDWTLHGAGHAWSGGDPKGSYTDAAGPDASAQMLRFFLALRAGADSAV